MRSLGKRVHTFLERQTSCVQASGTEIRQGQGHAVRNFPTMVKKVAELSFRNPEFVLFFRGQPDDHRNSKHSSTFYPAIFRPSDGFSLPRAELTRRFGLLGRSEKALMREYNLLGSLKVRRFQIVRWAILQHYEICDTPLLDVTTSLRVGCSFAQRVQHECCFVYVFALPQISGSVTASSEEGMQIVRLLSICPPSALRPHHQEAYLLGEYPTMTLDAKQEYERKELDFSRRLLCKFRIPGGPEFSPPGYESIPLAALFPDERDELLEVKRRMEEQGNNVYDLREKG